VKLEIVHVLFLDIVGYSKALTWPFDVSAECLTLDSPQTD